MAEKTSPKKVNSTRAHEVRFSDNGPGTPVKRDKSDLGEVLRGAAVKFVNDCSQDIEIRPKHQTKPVAPVFVGVGASFSVSKAGKETKVVHPGAASGIVVLHTKPAGVIEDGPKMEIYPVWNQPK
jgi:hypothetical protein